MKKIKFIPFFCGLLFFGNCYANNDSLKENKECDLSWHSTSHNIPDVDLYGDYFSDLKKLNQNSKTFKFDNKMQKRMVKSYINNKPFFAHKFIYDMVLTILDPGISNFEKVLEDSNNGLESKKEYIYKNAYSVRKFIFDIQKNYDEANRDIEILVPRIFFIFRDGINDDVKNILKQDKKIRSICTIMASAYIKTIVELFLKGENIDYNLDVKDSIKNSQYYSSNMTRSVTEANSQKISMLQIQLAAANCSYIMQDDDFTYLCMHIFDQSIANPGEFRDQTLNFLTMCKDNLLISSSKIYMYIPIPDDSIEESKKLVKGVRADNYNGLCKRF